MSRDAESQWAPSPLIPVGLGLGAALTELMVYVLAVPMDYGMGLGAGGRFALGSLFLVVTPVTWSLSGWSGFAAASEVRGRPLAASGVVMAAVSAGAVTGWIIASVWWFIWADDRVWLDPASVSADVNWAVVGWHAVWVAGPFVLVFTAAIIMRAVTTRIRERRLPDG